LRVQHLNCGSLHPPFTPLEGIVYCLLVETNKGLVLVDTGFGTGDCTHPTRLMRFFARLVGAPLDINETAVRQIERLGYSRDQVRHIVLTHLNLDHTGGLPDFPAAQVHVLRQEYDTIARPRGLVERGRVPAHWAHGPKWVIHEIGDRRWYGFGATPVLEGGQPEILLIHLPGHTRGHCGVAVATDQGWLLQCGDAASPFHPATDPYRPPGRKYPLGFLPGWVSRLAIGPNVPRLRELALRHGDEVRLISSHDTYSFLEFGGELSAAG